MNDRCLNALVLRALDGGSHSELVLKQTYTIILQCPTCNVWSKIIFAHNSLSFQHDIPGSESQVKEYPKGSRTIVS